MKRTIEFFLILIPVFAAFFCVSRPATVLAAEWRYAKDAIRLHLKGDPRLNFYQGNAHTLLVCVYSLKDPNAFTQLADEKDGIPKLLECGRFDPSVTQSKRLVVQPGKDVNESLDRPEGAKYVGVAAGYYDLRKERAVRFFPIPVTEEKRGNTIVSEPGVLNLNLTLGPQQLQEVSTSAPFSIPSKPATVLAAEWRYAKDAIRLHLKGDPRLNFYQGNAHTLLVCVYSLKDPDVFTQLADEKDGIPKLLECGRFDPSVTQSKRLVVQPGKDVNESLDRPEGAKYVGVAAGYYDLRKERAVRFFPIPVTEEKRGNTIVSEPGVLNLNLTLGPQQLQEVSTSAPFSIPSKPATVLAAEWRYAKDAIRLHLKGDPRLNFYQGNAHTLLVCVYSLKDPNAFTRLADEKDGIPKLLECGRFDPSVTQSKRLVVQPGKDVNESLDRPEGAKYVGVAAGYYDLRKERAVRFFPIPVTEEKRGNTIISEPGVLNLNLTLGPQQLQEAGGK